MKFFVYAIIIAGFTVVTGCGSFSGKKEILGIDSMKVVMWDMLKADELFVRLSVKDTVLKKRKENILYYEEVFAVHHITKGQFDSSFKFYEAHPVQLKILVDSLEAFSSREKSKIFEKHYGTH